MIATKLKRQMAQLKKDRLISGVPGGQAINQKFDEELDRMIEENFTL
jgi:phage shock protein PspC (stress-responsive transcriptional regulator)